MGELDATTELTCRCGATFRIVGAAMVHAMHLDTGQIARFQSDHAACRAEFVKTEQMKRGEGAK